MSGIDLDEITKVAARAAFSTHTGGQDLDTADAKQEEPYLTDLWEGWMRAGLAVVAPLIGEAIAQAIEAQATSARTCANETARMRGGQRNVWDDSRMIALDAAARIAREVTR